LRIRKSGTESLPTNLLKMQPNSHFIASRTQRGTSTF
jgi:hypothetical protein